MKSAYSVLGIPGNASRDDIERAYRVALHAYSKEQLVEQPELITKLEEVRTAYKVLIDPDSRTAHDRKLAQAVALPRSRSAPAPAAIESASPWYANPLTLTLVLLLGLGGIFGYVTNERAKAREAKAQALAAQAAQERAEAEKAAREAQQEQDKLAADSARRAREGDQAERRLRMESQYIANSAAYNNARQNALQAQAQSAERNAAWRAEAEARNEEQRRAYVAQQRMQEDRQRIRDLCYQNYRRYDC